MTRTHHGSAAAAASAALLAALCGGGCGGAPATPEDPSIGEAPPVIVAGSDEPTRADRSDEGAEQPSGASASSDDRPAGATISDGSGAERDVGLLGYAPLWQVEDPGGWNHSLAMAPSGDVLSLSAFSLTVLARHDGARLDHARICGGIALRGSALEVRDKSVLAVCSDGVEDVELPGMRRTERVKLPWTSLDERATSSAFGPKRLAVGNRAGDVLEIDLTSWRIVARHRVPSPGEIDSLAYTPDGAALAVSVDAGAGKPGQILLLRNGAFERVPNVADSSGAMAFSPDGRELFAEVRSFTAGRVSIVDGRVGNEQHVSSWLTAARWIDGSLVAATGAHGTALFPAAGEPAILSKETGEGLAVSADGKLLCSGSRNGEIRCWSRGAVAPSTYRPLGPPSAGSSSSGAAGTASGAASSPANEIAGTLRSRSGDRLVVELAAEPAPRVGASGELSKRVATNLGGLSITAWLTIAKVTVEKAQGRVVTLRIDEKTSQVNVNGKPMDHFTAGSEVRLTAW